MIFVGFIPVVIGKKAIGQTVRLPMFLDTVAAPAVIWTAYFGTNALSYIRTIHLVSSLSSLLSASQNPYALSDRSKFVQTMIIAYKSMFLHNRRNALKMFQTS